MRRLHSVLLASFAAIGFTSIASAADMPIKAPVYKAAPVAIYNWTGFYMGVNGGYGWNRSGSTELLTDDITPVNLGDATATSRGTIGDINGRGAFGGGQIGYNYQVSPQWLVGVEADLQASGIKASAAGQFTNPNGTFPITGNADLRVKWFGTARARLGYTNNNWLVYVTGGWAFGKVDYTMDATETGGGALFQTALSATRKSGYVIGGGVENAITSMPNLTWKIEYQYINLGTLNATAPVTLIATGAATGETASLGSVRADFHTVRVGLNYKFSSK